MTKPEKGVRIKSAMEINSVLIIMGPSQKEARAHMRTRAAHLYAVSRCWCSTCGRAAEHFSWCFASPHTRQELMPWQNESKITLFHHLTMNIAVDKTAVLIQILKLFVMTANSVIYSKSPAGLLPYSHLKRDVVCKFRRDILVCTAKNIKIQSFTQQLASERTTREGHENQVTSHVIIFDALIVLPLGGAVCPNLEFDLPQFSDCGP